MMSRERSADLTDDLDLAALSGCREGGGGGDDVMDRGERDQAAAGSGMDAIWAIWAA
jgi:hypothetical protein